MNTIMRSTNADKCKKLLLLSLLLSLIITIIIMSLLYNEIMSKGDEIKLCKTDALLTTGLM